MEDVAEVEKEVAEKEGRKGLLVLPLLMEKQMKWTSLSRYLKCNKTKKFKVIGPVPLDGDTV